MTASIRLPLAIFLGIAFSLATVASAAAQQKVLKTGKLIPEDAKFHDIVPKNAQIEIIVDGYVWTEGPAWVKDGGYLLFSDIPRNAVYKWQEGKGESLFLKPSGYTGKEKRENEDGSDEPGSNGLVVTPDGKHLILCQHGDRKVARTPLDKPGKFTYLAERYKGKQLNSPNDAVFHSEGTLYFTDPPYGLKKRYDDPARELDFCGVYRITKDGKVELLTKGMTRPMASPFPSTRRPSMSPSRIGRLLFGKPSQSPRTARLARAAFSRTLPTGSARCPAAATA